VPHEGTPGGDQCQLSVVSCQLSVVQLSVVSCQLSSCQCQLSVVSCQLFAVGLVVVTGRGLSMLDVRDVGCSVFFCAKSPTPPISRTSCTVFLPAMPRSSHLFHSKLHPNHNQLVARTAVFRQRSDPSTV